MKTDFHNKVFALSLALRTRKWPINISSTVSEKGEPCETLGKISMHRPISKNVVGENDECQLSNGDCTNEKKCGY